MHVHDMLFYHNFCLIILESNSLHKSNALQTWHAVVFTEVTNEFGGGKGMTVVKVS